MTPLFLLALLACSSADDAPPALVATPTTLDLGTVAVGDAASATIELRNDGGGRVEILSATLVDGETGAWTVAREGFAPLEGDAVSTVTVTFAPLAAGASPAALEVRSDDPETPSLAIRLAATGGASTEDADNDGYSPAEGDCDDGDASVLPGAAEQCDGKDTDCDGDVPADEVDADGDAWFVCDADCDDADATVYPGAPEACDDKDTDCDGELPDRADADGDGHTLCDDDCDDGDAAAFPGNPEVCDGIDNDCSGAADDLDADGDGASPCGAVPDCDDADAAAYPVFVDATATGGDGTELAPVTTIAEALALLDDTCRTVGVFSGTYAESVAWSAGDLAIVGLAGDPSGVVFTPPEGERAFTVTGGAITLANLALVGVRASDGDGGAMVVRDASAALVGVVATLNVAPGDGGAVAVSSGALTLDGCTFTSNTAGGSGGAVALDRATLADAGSSYVDNAALRGGGVYAASSALVSAGASFLDNRARGDGGGLALASAESVRIDRALFAGNTAADAGGGAALADVVAPTGWLRNARFLDNIASEGGGLAFTGDEAALLVANNTLVGNSAADGGAAVLVRVAEPSLTVWSNIWAWNVGETGLESPTGLNLAYNIGHATSGGDEFGGDVDASNLVADPVFLDFSDNGDPYDDDLTLGPGSPARDSGPPAGEGPAFYADQWTDVDGSENDRGYTGGRGGD